MSGQPAAQLADLSRTGWHEGPLVGFDVETSGVDYETDRIVTACVARAGGTGEASTRSWLVNPGVEIPEGATAVHGVTTERARAEGADPKVAIEEMTTALAAAMIAGLPVVAFNARFDLTMLDREARRHGLRPLVDLIGGPEALLVVDPFVLDKQVDRFRRGKRTLSHVCAHYGVVLEDAHDAGADTMAAMRLAYRMAQRFPRIGDRTLVDLCAEQEVWAAEQAESLEQYFRRQGKDEHVERAWPIVPVAS